jgi:hypothetical protein
MSRRRTERYIKGVRGAKAHLKQRFLERYGMAVTNKEIYAIIESIQGGIANFIRRDDEETAVYGLAVRGEWVWIVFNSEIGFPITVLPKSEMEKSSQES